MSKILITGSDGFIASSFLSKSSFLKSTQDIEVICVDVSNKINAQNFIHIHELSDNIIEQCDYILHMGAISETNYNNEMDLWLNNIWFSQRIFMASKQDCRILYASSAAVYGDPNNMCPMREDQTIPFDSLSLYAKSKKICDDIVCNYFSRKNILGLRFFNVSSFDMEENKKQPSPTFSFLKQLKTHGIIKLFNGSNTIYRDFIYIYDVVNIIDYFLLNIEYNGIVNVGSSKPISFESVADAIINRLGYGQKQYIDKPKNLHGSYQHFTKSDNTKLVSMKYNKKIPSILEYINTYEF